YHLLHFTVQTQYINLTGQNFVEFTDPQKRHDIFKMMVVGFENVWISGFYVVGIALLCLHLSHGVSSMFQSLGWKNQAYGPFLDKLARISALLIFLGYVSIPIAILSGYGRGYVKDSPKVPMQANGRLDRVGCSEPFVFASAAAE